MQSAINLYLVISCKLLTKIDLKCLIRWKQLIARFNKRKEALNQLAEKSQKIEDGCDFVEALLNQADSDLTKLEDSDASDSSEINRIMSEAQVCTLVIFVTLFAEQCFNSPLIIL